MSKSAIVIGAGIVGLATARALAVRGYQVTVLEKNDEATGASVRNFGMIWPIGQPAGMMYERAIQSKQIWKQVCKEAGIWIDEVGSLHLAYNDEEEQVLEEFFELAKRERNCFLLNAAETLKQSGAVVAEGLHSALYSTDEMIVDPREAIQKLPRYLKEKYPVQFIWGAMVTKISYPSVWCNNNLYEADEIFVCTGAEFELLFPELYALVPLTKCKLQMMRLQPQNLRRIGPALCGGLSLIHYKSFEGAPSLALLKEKFKRELPEYLQWGIHVMAAQNESGQVTIGDSHEYGNSFEPFDKAFINEMIVDYLGSFALFANGKIVETWHGIYPKLTDGSTEIVIKPQEGVTIINGLGGAGMTLSFGLCESVIAENYKKSLTIS